MKQFSVDGIDKMILKELMTDARTPFLEIARKVGISGAAIHQRINKMKAGGLIEGSRFVINPRVLGYRTVAYVGVFLDRAWHYKEVVGQLKKIPEVIECHYTTGNWSIFIKIQCFDNEHLMKLLNKNIQGVEGVTRTETFISLDQPIDRQIEP